MKIKALKNTTKTLKNLSDDQMFVGVLVIVSVIYVTLVVKSDNSNDRLLNFYSSPSGILFGTALIVVALAVNHASIKKMVPILGKYSKKTAILSGFVVFFNIFSLIYAGKVREDLLIPSGGELKYVDDEDGRVVKKKFQFTNADDVDFDDGESGGNTGGTTGGNSGGGGNTGGSDDDICEEGMTKKQLKKIKKKLKAEAKTATGEDKEEIKRQIKICRNLQRGGDGGNTGGDSSGSDDDICEEGMNKKDIKTEIKKLRAEKKIATGERKEEVKRQLNTCKALRDGDVGGGTTGGTTGGNSGDSDDDICEEGMNKKEIKKEIKKLKGQEENCDR